jgi:hypothetical protein
MDNRQFSGFQRGAFLGCLQRMNYLACCDFLFENKNRLREMKKVALSLGVTKFKWKTLLWQSTTSRLDFSSLDMHPSSGQQPSINIRRELCHLVTYPHNHALNYLINFQHWHVTDPWHISSGPSISSSQQTIKETAGNKQRRGSHPSSSSTNL